jgi:hypothetical protein
VKALAATAITSVREIQALQAPHIAEAGDEVMTRLEERMTVARSAAGNALDTLRPLVPPRALDEAVAALARFDEVHGRILALSRRNSDVRSLVLSLDEKTKLTAACDESLRGLRDQLAKRTHRSSRY